MKNLKIKYLKIFFFICLPGMISCEDDPVNEIIPDEISEDTKTTTKEKDIEILDKLYTEIRALSEQERCTDAANWDFTAVGEKGCGGPAEYMAYSSNIDVKAFLSKVAHYTNQVVKFNKKWGVVSDCSIQPAPKDVECKDGKAVLIF